MAILRLEQKKSDLINQVLHLTRERLEKRQAEDICRFIQQFYRNVPPDDILGEPAEQLFAAALSLVRFGDIRQPGAAKVRAFNPRVTDDGWHSRQTIVEIVNDDMPFLVDSVTAGLNELGHVVHLVIHPVVGAMRDDKGKITGEPSDDRAIPESFMQIRIGQTSDAAELNLIESTLLDILRDVRAAVEDWRTMRQRLKGIVQELAQTPQGLPAEEGTEGRDFLAWLDDDHFTYLGYRDYSFSGTDDDLRLQVVPGSGLGVLRDDSYSVFDGLRNFDKLPPEVQAFLRQPRLLLVTKSNRKATVHRSTHMDAIAIKKFGPDGSVVGERLFVGLFTSSAYARSPRDIPLLTKKIQYCIERAGFTPASHDGKALQHILETYPRDELFQIAEDELFDITMGILHLQERQRVALFVRHDPFERFISCLIYVPRDRFNTHLRLELQAIVAAAYDGEVTAFYTHLGDSVLTRLHLIIKTTPGKIPAVDIEALEDRLIEAARDWTDRLKDALVDMLGEENSVRLYRRYAQAFPTTYRDTFSAETAVQDLRKIEEARRGSGLAIDLYRPEDDKNGALQLKIFNAGGQIVLSDVLPMLENMGLRVIDEVPYPITPPEHGTPVWVHDFGVRAANGAPFDLGAVKSLFEDAFAHIWSRAAEDDGFNKLTLLAGLPWRDVVILRAYCKYLRQAGIPFSQSYMEQTLATNTAIATQLVRLFHLMFEPATTASDDDLQLAAKTILKALDTVANLDEDRILRRFLNAIQSTLRTNFYQPAAEGAAKSYVSFKLDSHAIDDLPLPRPMVEVFVYSPRVEAIHLRGGKVARGGIRWSDRREDFRTEVLGLLKAQMVKNAVIVPVGSKGGFVVKMPPTEGGREALMAEVIECYKTLIRGLLDITDNLKGSSVVPPSAVKRRDGDDPYLVVAADKGTATFSDIANGVAIDYGFWLGDAFASGGSAGYDHKKMGITAKGAWECVKRHFREQGVDIQSQDFTCVGVGDMSGDVFGNGMLLSPHTKLVGAFNHLHIFVDPDPDPARGFAERKRLFDLPRSAWTDYDASAISAGGGVFERKAKSIAVSPQMKARFGLDKDSVTPNELIKAMLKAPVDLLWLGGIGTYVKSTTESNADAGDRANDAVRVNGMDLRCRVVGEGANLGFTQLGRIEFAAKGGAINTDAVDNSAGVDCSDHEVNIKILLNAVMEAGALKPSARDDLLAAMTDEVARLVLQDNYLQSQSISMVRQQGWVQLEQQGRFMRALERDGKLDRDIEYLPSDEILRQRLARQESLTRPELAVLMAYGKIALYDALLPTSLPDDPFFRDQLKTYFPVQLQQAYAAQLPLHRLKREIVATVVINEAINRLGPTAVLALKEKTELPEDAILRAYHAVRTVFDLPSLWADIEALDNRIPAAAQLAMLEGLQRVTESATLWFLRQFGAMTDLPPVIERFQPGIAALQGELDQRLPEMAREKLLQRREELLRQGVPATLSNRVAATERLLPVLDIIRIAEGGTLSLPQVADAYFTIGQRFGFDWLRNAMGGVAMDTHWDRLALAAFQDELYGQQRDLTASVIQQMGADIADRLSRWMSPRARLVQQTDGLLHDLQQAGGLDLARLAVASRQLRRLTDAAA